MLYADEDEGASINSYSTDNMTSHSDNSYFDPPLENYRFFYKGDSASVNKQRTDQTGLILKQRRPKQ